MKHINTQAIVLNRTNYREADRIITFLTPDQGKVRVLARGVRKVKSKLAGGIELFSISDISYLIGRGEVYTLTSSRLIKHFGDIVKDQARTEAAYDFIKHLDKNTADNPEPAYFELLAAGLEVLDKDLDVELARLWFSAQMLRLAGLMPNLETEKDGNRLKENQNYQFDDESKSFVRAKGRGKLFTPNDIKFLRLLFEDSSPQRLKKIDGLGRLLSQSSQLLMKFNSF